MERLVEQALLLGPRKSMVGVITPASARAAVPDAPFVVILNAGIIHRVGPFPWHKMPAIGHFDDGEVINQSAHPVQIA